MPNSSSERSLLRGPLAARLLLTWYVASFFLMAIAPLDRKVWFSQNILPVLLVATLVLTHRAFPLSNLAYLLVTIWLTLHTVAVHYTYPKVPLGFWLERWFDLHRNHFDRIVHFSFGFLLAYPLEDVFRRVQKLKGWMLSYVVVMTILGFSACWEIFEAWIGQVAHPDLELAFVGHQGDVWDPQRDIAAALYGVLLSVALLAFVRWLRQPGPAVEPDVVRSEVVSDL
jgi:putative membrane protein